jgi:multisubunit Na+/H+ antiporter MnhE subunit
VTSFFFLVLAGIGWMALLGSVSWSTFAVGVLLGAVIWRVEGGLVRGLSPLRAVRLTRLGLRVLAIFLWELVVANAQQLRIVFAPRIAVCPRWIRFRTELQSPGMRALLGVMVTLTPGAVTYEESRDAEGAWCIGIHVLDTADEAATVARIRTRLERPLRAMEVL